MSGGPGQHASCISSRKDAIGITKITFCSSRTTKQQWAKRSLPPLNFVFHHPERWTPAANFVILWLSFLKARRRITKVGLSQTTPSLVADLQFHHLSLHSYISRLDSRTLEQRENYSSRAHWLLRLGAPSLAVAPSPRRAGPGSLSPKRPAVGGRTHGPRGGIAPSWSSEERAGGRAVGSAPRAGAASGRVAGGAGGRPGSCAVRFRIHQVEPACGCPTGPDEGERQIAEWIGEWET